MTLLSSFSMFLFLNNIPTTISSEQKKKRTDLQLTFHVSNELQVQQNKLMSVTINTRTKNFSLP